MSLQRTPPGLQVCRKGVGSSTDVLPQEGHVGVGGAEFQGLVSLSCLGMGLLLH